MIWFPFYPSDFIGATVGLSCQEVSVYNWMLTLYYELGPFPTDPVRTYRIVRCESDEQKRTVDFLLSQFFVLRDDGWYQPRAEKEKVKAAQQSEVAREKANKRWHPAVRHAAALPQHSGSNAVAMPTTTTTTTTSTSTTTTKAKERQKTKAPAAPSDVSPQVWQDWQSLRKAKKAAVTDTAVAGIRREAAKVGMSLEDAMRMCCERGWAGFKADWVTAPAAGRSTLEERNRAAAERMKQMLDDEERTING